MSTLQGSSIGTLVPISGFDARFGEAYDAHAFIPDDLPNAVALPPSVWMTVGDAMAELGRLDMAANLIPNPQLIARVATRREAIGTSALEGTYADLTELFAAEALPAEEQKADVAPNVREVLNYARAAEVAYEWIVDRPITWTMLSALQAMIVADNQSDGDDAGAIRTTQVFIGAKNRRVREARFIPPPPGDQLFGLCLRWLDWITDADPAVGIPLIARVAMAHYQFEALHPFTDGNGRLGRLVALLQMVKDGALRLPVLSVSPWLKDRASDYRDHLLKVSATGDWAPWIEFFARAVIAESRSGHERILRLLALRDEFGATVRTALPRARLALEIAYDLIAYPLLSIADSHRRYGRSNQANRDAIASLVNLGILEPYTAERYGRLYWSRRVIHTMDS
ncbi:MAG TPA: Fic/DOC family N-terminal domain-containing protein [Mycobacterium sp.]